MPPPQRDNFLISVLLIVMVCLLGIIGIIICYSLNLNSTNSQKRDCISRYAPVVSPSTDIYPYSYPISTIPAIISANNIFTATYVDLNPTGGFDVGGFVVGLVKGVLSLPIRCCRWISGLFAGLYEHITSLMAKIYASFATNIVLLLRKIPIQLNILPPWVMQEGMRG
ncbi:hypothetical protein TWF481_004459 [Arthrobotrys musiformis]|uniref:Transmembrane protein n=1 Tax=Arthrobotrys musiformis TaxID=47236 RepID=A0AAV9WKS0_9PEZI